MMINSELFEFTKPGFCRDEEDENGKYKSCLIEIIPTMQVNPSLDFDSVYVFEKQWYQPERVDSTTMRIYISASQNLMVKKEKYSAAGQMKWTEKLLQREKK